MSVSSLLSSLSTARGLYFVVLLLVSPWVDYCLIDRRYTSSHARLRIYKFGIAYLVAASVVGYLLHDHHDVLHAATSLQRQAGWHALYGGWLHYGLLALTVASTVASIHSWYRCCVDAPYRATHQHQLRPLRYLLPVTATERRWYAALSTAAALCEELIYRTMLLRWLAAHMGPGAAVLVGAAGFGAAHGYQGLGGAVRAGVAGLVFGVVYVVCGSWWLVVALHAMADWQVLLLYRPMVDAPEEAKKLIKGCKLEVE